jgi:hypothetical protein
MICYQDYEMYKQNKIMYLFVLYLWFGFAFCERYNWTIIESGAKHHNHNPCLLWSEMCTSLVHQPF